MGLTGMLLHCQTILKKCDFKCKLLFVCCVVSCVFDTSVLMYCVVSGIQ